jgi:Na+/H+-dicarboxylate symporter
MGRTATNVIGNGIATAVVAKWEGQTVEEAEDEATAAPAAVAQPQAQAT